MGTGLIYGSATEFSLTPGMRCLAINTSGINEETEEKLNSFFQSNFHVKCGASILEQFRGLRIVRKKVTAKTRPGADYGSDHELLIAKFRLKLMKVGKTTRPFRYDLNQIPYDYTVEVTSRLKGLDLIECLKNYRWKLVTLYRRQ